VRQGNCGVGTTNYGKKRCTNVLVSILALPGLGNSAHKRSVQPMVRHGIPNKGSDMLSVILHISATSPSRTGTLPKMRGNQTRFQPEIVWHTNDQLSSLIDVLLLRHVKKNERRCTYLIQQCPIALKTSCWCLKSLNMGSFDALKIISTFTKLSLILVSTLFTNT